MNTQYSSNCYNNNTTYTFLPKNPVITFQHKLAFLSLQLTSVPDLNKISKHSMRPTTETITKNKYCKLPETDFELMLCGSAQEFYNL